MNKGILYGLGAYAMWGFFPIYWKLLHHVPALQLLGHRILWSFILLVLLLAAVRLMRDFRQAVTRKVLGIYTLAAVLLAVNWLTYVWAVNAGFIVETSLGYFINPLLSVLLGVLILRERLRPFQWVPLALAAAGVVFLAVTYGQLPWIALTLAFSFGFYGLAKKLAPLSSLFGLTLETGILLIPAIGYLAWSQAAGEGAFLHTGLRSDLLMVGAGVATTIPLLLFASAARRVPLTTLGLLQYIAPTIQFLLGVFVYREPFDRSHLIGFGMVWVALVIFWLENFLSSRVPVEPIPEMGEG